MVEILREVWKLNKIKHSFFNQNNIFSCLYLPFSNRQKFYLDLGDKKIIEVVGRK